MAAKQAKQAKPTLSPAEKKALRTRTKNKLIKDRWLYLLLLPGVVYFILFKFAPMWGVLIAFKDYYAGNTFLRSPWVGFEHFQTFFTDSSFVLLLKNTLIISGMNLVFYFPLPILLALLLNELKVKWYKNTVQTMVYVPHFVSWVVIASISFMLLKQPSMKGYTGGALYEIIKIFTGSDYNILADTVGFYWILLFQAIWKETGWGTIIFLAALAGVDVEQYEAAIVDGANRFQQLIYITFPAISSTIIIMLILRMGSVLDTGFEQILLMQNDLNKSSTNTFDTYVYDIGRVNGNYGYSTAVGLFKSLVSIICIQSANFISKKVSETSLF